MIKVLVKAESRYPVERANIRTLVSQILAQHGIKDNALVSIIFVGDRKMTMLHKKYMGQATTTDVLSYSLFDEEKKDGFVLPPDNNLYLGDIVVSFPQARRQAGEFNRTVDEEINRLVEHGLLHLLGIHHE